MDRQTIGIIGGTMLLFWIYLRRSAGAVAGTGAGVDPGFGTATIPPGAPPAVVKWRDLAVEHGARFGVSPQLVLAVIWQESSGIESATGSIGEVGLMQITEGAAQDVGAGVSYTPDANIFVGTAYLALQIRRMNGDVYNGLRAYNAGETGARRSPKNGAQYAREVLQKAGWI